MAEQRAVIAGGGMVGAATALGLAQLGWQVVVVERQQQTARMADPVPLRVSALNPQSLALLDKLGVLAPLSQLGFHSYRQLEVSEGAAAAACFSAAEVGDERLGAFIANDELQAVLWQQLRSHPQVVCCDGQQIHSLSNSASGVDVLLSNGERYQAELLIGAEGGQSQVRQLAGIGVEGWDYGQQCLALTVALEQESGDTTWQCFTPDGPRAYLPLWRNQSAQQWQASLVWYDRPQRLKQALKLPDDALINAVRQAYPRPLPEFRLLKRALFPLRRQQARGYVRGRVVVLGDAAHQINPLAGLGVNLGFADLGLLLELLGRTPLDSALSQLNVWRWPQNLAAMTAMDLCYGLFSSHHPLLQQSRSLALGLVRDWPQLRRLGMRLAGSSWTPEVGRRLCAKWGIGS